MLKLETELFMNESTSV